MNRLKNASILIVLISFLGLVAILPVTCIFQTVTGIFCPACGMTRAFHCILQFDFVSAMRYNILAIPLFGFLLVSVVILGKEIVYKEYRYIPKVLFFLHQYGGYLLFAVLVSFFWNNLK